MRPLTFSTAILIAGATLGLLSALHELSVSGLSPANGADGWISYQPQKSSFRQIYATQHFLSDGSLPPPKSNLLYQRELDDGGNLLRADCDYEMIGDAIQSRWWSFSVVGEGSNQSTDSLAAGAALIDQDGKLTINLSRQPQSANWVKVPDVGNYHLVVVVNDPLAQVQLPQLKKIGMWLMGRLFWFVTALFLSVAIHISYVLFMPNLAFNRQLAEITKNSPSNQFALLEPGKQGQLLLGATPNDIVGLCKLDLSKGKVNLNADLPPGYWTLTVYDMSGQQVYALNDAQAGAQQFTVDFAKAKSISQQLFGKGDPEDGVVSENLGWHAEVVGDQGLALLWVPLADPLLRAGMVEKLSKTKCGLAAP